MVMVVIYYLKTWTIQDLMINDVADADGVDIDD
jgi:hypothetical protein